METYRFPEFINSNVMLTNGKIIQGPEISDHAFALLLALTRNMYRAIPNMKKEEFNKGDYHPIELRGKTAVIIGVGGIGSQIAQRARAFGMTVIGVDPKDMPFNPDVSRMVTPDRLDTVLPLADVVFISAPHTPQSEGNWAHFADDTPLKQTARRMITMVGAINKNNFGGARALTCYTCHRGDQRPKVVPSLAVQYGPPLEDPNELEIIARTGLPSADALRQTYAKTAAQVQKDLELYLAGSSFNAAIFDVKLRKSDEGPDIEPAPPVDASRCLTIPRTAKHRSSCVAPLSSPDMAIARPSGSAADSHTARSLPDSHTDSRTDSSPAPSAT